MTFTVNSWDDGNALIEGLLGGGVGLPPARCPVVPALACIEAWVEGRGEYVDYGGGLPRFNLTVVRAVFGVQKWEAIPTEDPGGQQSFPNEDAPGQPYVYATCRLDYSSETVKLPNGSYHFETGGKPVNVPIVGSVGVASLVFTRKFVNTLPTALILSMMNKVNDDTMFGATRGKVRFAGARTSKEFLSDASRVQELEYHFRYHEFGWNHYHKEDERVWDRIIDSSSRTPLAYADLKQLLK